MDFSLSSLKNAFNSEYYSEKADYILYAFLLIRTSDEKIFPGLINRFTELHHTTGKIVLIISPKFSTYNKMSNKELAEFLRRKFLGLDGWYEEKAVSDFLIKQDEESYVLREYLGIPREDLPCIVFFDSLKEKSDYFVWRIEGMAIDEIMSQLESMLDELESKFKDLIKSVKEKNAANNRKNELILQSKKNLNIDLNLSLQENSESRIKEIKTIQSQKEEIYNRLKDKITKFEDKLKTTSTIRKKENLLEKIERYKLEAQIAETKSL